MIVTTTPADYNLNLALIKRVALEKRVDGKLLAALIIIESGGNRFAQNYNSNYTAFHQVEVYCRALNQTYLTERVGQATAHGLMQVMGATARWLGFKGYFGQLYEPETNIRLGADYLVLLKKKYDNENDVISSYNQGGPYKDQNGQYKNSYYVDRVQREMKAMELWF